MILEPRKSAEEIERRLAALHDPELADLLDDLNRRFSGGEDPQSYTSPSAPYWKRRIALVALAGLLATSAGFASTVTLLREKNDTKPRVPVPLIARKHYAKAALVHLAPKHRVLVAPHIAAAPHNAAAAPVRIAPVTAPDEAAIRQMRAQLLHERLLAAQAQARAMHEQREAQLARRAEAMAREWQHAEALAQARAEARAEAASRTQAQDAAALARDQDRALQNASDPNIKPGDNPPADGGTVSRYPSGGMPLPMPGPVDTNCTPHRGSLFGAVLGRTLLSHVRVGNTNVGAMLQLVNH